MKSGGRIPWNFVAICETSKTSWQTGKLRMNEDLENLSKDQLFHSVDQWNLSQTLRDSENSSIRNESITRNFSRLCFDRGVNLERRHSDC